MIDSEMWKAIPGYEGLYDASTLGRIRSVDGKITHTDRHGDRHWRSRVLSGRGVNLKTGYRVNLWRDGVKKDWLVARLVGMTFLGGPPYADWTINHKDGNRLNNNIENLEWLSLEDNIRHAFQTGLHSCQRLTILEDSEKRLVFRSMSLAGRSLGRNSGYIHNCIKRGRLAKSIAGDAYRIFVVC